jgi:hypothetical protein
MAVALLRERTKNGQSKWMPVGSVLDLRDWTGLGGPSCPMGGQVGIQRGPVWRFPELLPDRDPFA